MDSQNASAPSFEVLSGHLEQNERLNDELLQAKSKLRDAEGDVERLVEETLRLNSDLERRRQAEDELKEKLEASLRQREEDRRTSETLQAATDRLRKNNEELDENNKALVQKLGSFMVNYFITTIIFYIALSFRVSD